MARPHGPWTVLDTERPYADEFLSVAVDAVLRPDGERGTYATVGVKAGVAILALDEAGRAVLVRQFRYALGRTSLEVVAGGLEEGEEPLASAQRELKEEVGGEAARWTAMGAVDLDTSIVRCPVHLFVADGVTLAAPEREGTEALTTEVVPLDEAVARVERGEITHAASCVLLLRAARERLRP